MPGHVDPSASTRSAAHRAWLLGTTALLPPVTAAAAALLLGGLPPRQAQAQATPGLAANAAPSGGRVAAGAAAIAQTPARTQVTQSTDRAVIDWRRFDVGRAHHVDFRQPAASSWTLNRVAAPDPSMIAGSITANGGVAIVNRSGVTFAAGAQVNVGSLIASASDIANEDFMAGRMRFDRPPRPGARVENHGTVTVADRGLAALAAPEVRNSGVIRARLGRVALAGTEAFTIDLAGDGLVSLDVTQAVRRAPTGGAAALVTNSGLVAAEGGSVLLTAHAASGLVETLVANTGRIEAPTAPAATAGAAARPGAVALRARGGDVRVAGTVAARGGGADTRGGSVEVTATGGAVTLAPGAQVDVSGTTGGGRATLGAALSSARGRPERLAQRTTVRRGAEVRADATARGDGGEVIVHAAGRTEMLGRVTARGGPGGGAGGRIEVSSRGAFAMDGAADASAPAGVPGSVLIDPVALRVVETLSGSQEPAEVTAASIGGNPSDVTLAADSEVRVLAGIDKPAGGLSLLTLVNTGADNGTDRISIEAPINLGTGNLFLSTGGSIGVDIPATFADRTVQAAFGITMIADGPITNAATLSSPFSVNLASGPLSGAVGDISITNTGVIAAGTVVSLVASGPFGAAATGSVTNTGVITGGSGGPFDGVRLSAGGLIRNEGEIRGFGGGGDNEGTRTFAVELRSGGAVENLGAIRGLLAPGQAGDGSIGIFAGTAIRNDAGTGCGAGGGGTGCIAAAGDAFLLAAGSVTNAGRIEAGRDAVVATGERSQVVSNFAGGNDTIPSGEGDITGPGSLDLLPGGFISNTGEIAAARDATVVAGAYGAFVTDAAAPRPTRQILGAAPVQPGAFIDNAGAVSAGRDATLATGTYAETRGAGTVFDPPGAGTVAYTATLGDVTVTGALPLLTGGRIASRGTVAAGRDATLLAGTAIDNAGAITGTGTAGPVLVEARTDLANAGTITGAGDVTVTAGAGFGGAGTGSVGNGGTIAAGGSALVQALQGSVANTGTITAADALSDAATEVVAATAITNTGAIEATGGGLVSGGVFLAAGVRLDAGSFIDSGGTIAAGTGAVRLSAFGAGLPTAGQDWSIRQTGGAIRAPGTGAPADPATGLPVSFEAGQVEFVTGTGGVLQTGGALVARRLSGAVGGAVTLDGAANAVDALGRFRAGTEAASAAEAGFTLRTGQPRLLVTDVVSVGVREIGTPAIAVVDPAATTVVFPGGTIALAADDLEFGPAGLLRAPDGLVAITPHGAGRHLALARQGTPTGAGGELALGAVELQDHILADRLRLGAGPDGSTLPRAGSIRHYAGNLDFVTGQTTPGGTEGRPRALELFATGDIQQRGRSGGVAAETEGAGPDTADGTRGWLRVSELGGEAGGLAWFGADNRIGTLAGFAAGTEFTLRNAPAATTPGGAGSGEPANGLAIGAPVRVGAGGGRLTIVADTLRFADDIAGMLSAPGGTIEILPATAGRPVVFAPAPDPGALGLDTAAVGLIGDPAAPTAVLRIGRSEDPAVAGNPAWPLGFALGRAEAPVVGDTGATGPGPRTAGDIAIGGDLPLRGGATTTRVARLDLFAGAEGTPTGAIAQLDGTSIDVATLAGESRRGTRLASAANRIDALAGFRAGTAATTADQAVFALSSRLGAAGAEQPLAVTGEVAAGVRGDGGIARQDGSIGLAAPGLLLQADLTTSPTAGVTRLEATRGDIVQTGAGRVLTGQILASSARDLLLEAGPNAAGTLLAPDPATGTLAPRDVRLRVATPLALSGALAAGRDLAIASDAGLTAAPGAGVTAGGTLTLSAGTELTLDGATLTAGGAMRLAAGASAVLARAAIAADTLVLRAGPPGDAVARLRLDGVAFTLGAGALFGAGGGIEAGAPSSLQPRDPGAARLPVALFDTRRGAAALGAIPAGVEPDRPGLAPDRQATQVRLPGQDAPGDFGPAGADPAGPVQLNLEAGRSPVFLLLDGGTAAGTLAAGRLGVHGRGGAADLAGSLGGLTGETAALAPNADITRPIGTAEQQDYRFNGCIIGSIACTVAIDERLVRQVPINLPAVAAQMAAEAAAATAAITRLFVPEPELVRLRRLRGRLADPDVLLPNTVEEDY